VTVAKVTPKGSGQGSVPLEIQGGCAVAPNGGDSGLGLWVVGLLLMGAAPAQGARAPRFELNYSPWARS
jgi:hypothetical protein